MVLLEVSNSETSNNPETKLSWGSGFAPTGYAVLSTGTCAAVGFP